LFLPSPRRKRPQREVGLPRETSSLRWQSCLELRRRHPGGTESGILRSGLWPE